MTFNFKEELDLIKAAQKYARNIKTMCPAYYHSLPNILHKLKKSIEEKDNMLKNDIGEFSDGYHSFNELYHHRTILFSVICNQHPDLAWKSLHHHDPNEPMYDGMFIVGIDTPTGQATYHCDIDPYWDMFNIPELDRAPEWDGHTPDDAIQRISTIVPVENDSSLVDIWDIYDLDSIDPGKLLNSK